MENSIRLQCEDIFEYLKNRPPMLMIRNATVVPGESSYSELELTKDDWFFECHFPGNPIMPGVLQLETLFNTAALAIKLMEGKKFLTTNISRIKDVAFHFQICPGDLVHVETTIVKKYRHGVAWFLGKLIVRDRVACEASFSITVAEEMIVF